MSVSSNRAVCARRLVQEKLCNLLFNQQKCGVTLISKRNLGTSVFPQSTQSSPFMRINQHNNKFGSFIKHSQVSLTLCPKLANFDLNLCCITKFWTFRFVFVFISAVIMKLIRDWREREESKIYAKQQPINLCVIVKVIQSRELCAWKFWKWQSNCKEV